MKKHLVTSALPYINGIKHLGNLVGSMLPADVYARHLRQQGEDVLYICGTDEHGTPAELAADKHNTAVSDFCENMYTVQKDIYEKFSLSFDYFGRTSDKNNHEITQEIFLALDRNGYITEQSIRQFYSIEDQRFLPDRFVSGTCPHCGDEGARGDQCEACGRLLDPTDLVNPRSSISGSQDIELRETHHLFLSLSKLQPVVEKWIETRDDWSSITKGIAKKWLSEGLEDRCITRDTDWGVPVPKEGYENKRFYVWFDAPMGYISMSKDLADQQGNPDAWKDWWLADNVEYDQFMAKDNVPFHCIFWPAMVLGSELGFKQPERINAVNWLTFEKGKFSTSNNRGVFTDQALEEFGGDYWRYYLTSIMPESSDSDFTFEAFANTINADIVNNLGNFASRVCTLVIKNFDAETPVLNQPFEYLEEKEFETINKMVDDIDTALRGKKFLQAISSIRALWSYANEYITLHQPWKLVKENKQHAAEVLSFCVHLIKLSAVVSNAVIPNLTKVLAGMIGLEEDLEKFSFAKAKEFESLSKSFTVNKPEKIFDKIPEERVAELTEKYGGDSES